MYYKKVGESRNSYTRLIFLNEMLSGQDIDYIDNLIEYEKEPPLRFNQEQCYVGLLGLKKVVYSGYYRLTTNEYMEIYVTFEQMAAAYFAAHHLDGEIVLTLYSDKQIAVIFSVCEKSDVTAMEVYKYLQDTLQQMYQETFLKDGIYCNQTFILTEPVSRAQIPEYYQRLQKMSNLSYFLEEPGLVWQEWIEQKKQEAEPEEIRELGKQLFQAVNDCDKETCAEALRDLFLCKIKNSFDFYLLQENLVTLKRFYTQICNVYDIPMETDRNVLFDGTRYPKIEQLKEAIQEGFFSCMDIEARKGQQYSRIVRECIQILKANYCRPDISLTYAAEQINISPSYLSSAFNREVQSNIARYIINLRMEKAKELLMDRRLNISEIAVAVGFENKRYFSELFKQEMKMTPREFRQREFEG